MANIDLATPSLLPAFESDAAVGTTCVVVRVPAYHACKLFATGAVYLFQGVAEGGSVPATARLALDAGQAAQGFPFSSGGGIAGASYGTICVAAQSGTVEVRVVVEPGSRTVI